MEIVIRYIKEKEEDWLINKDHTGVWSFAFQKGGKKWNYET